MCIFRQPHSNFHQQRELSLYCPQPSQLLISLVDKPALFVPVKKYFRLLIFGPYFSNSLAYWAPKATSWDACFLLHQGMHFLSTAPASQMLSFGWLIVARNREFVTKINWQSRQFDPEKLLCLGLYSGEGMGPDFLQVFWQAFGCKWTAELERTRVVRPFPHRHAFSSLHREEVIWLFCCQRADIHRELSWVLPCGVQGP